MDISCPLCKSALRIQQFTPTLNCPVCKGLLDLTPLKSSFANTPMQSNLPGPGSSMQPRPPMPMDLNSAFNTVAKGLGQINCDQLKESLQLMGLQISSDVCNQLALKHDRDRSNLIDINEFSAIVSELNQWRDAFAFFDTDHSGFMDYNEFSQALIRLGYSFPPPTVSLIFSNLDSNHVGTLNLDNFIKACSVIQIVAMKMQQYDPQRKGYVTLDFNQMMDVVFSIPM